MASLAELEQLEEKLNNERNALGAQYKAGDVSVLPQIKALNAEIAAVGRQINALLYPPASAAADVKASDDSTVQNPQAVGGFGQPLTFGANGRIVDPNVESGTNPPVITTIESQSVNPNAFNAQYETTPGGPAEYISPGDNGRAEPSGTAGVAAPSDDSGSRQSTANIINTAFNGKITSQPNVLDQYASYTYNIGWYIMSPASYERFTQTGKKDFSGLQLLVQSGGAANGSSGGQTAGNATAMPGGRSDFFGLDYYFDNLEIQNFLTGKGTGTSHNLTKFKFTVVEPNGITLLGNLRRAAESFYTKQGIQNSNYVDAIYCLVIRFYGYDSQGRIVQVGKDINSSTAPRAVVEKFFPFQIADIQFKMASGKIEYQVDATAIGHAIGFGSDRNVIYYNTEVSGRTLKDLLVGDITTANQSTSETDGRETETSSAPQSTDQASGAPPKADAAGVAKFSGLMEALNKYQKQLTNQGVFEVADEYSLEFVPKELGDSLVLKDGTPYYDKSPIQEIKTGNQAVDPETQSANFGSRTATAFAGMSITQFIDQQMRASKYVTDQSNVYYDEETGEKKTRTPLKQIAWFKINVVATPKTEKFDKKRGDFAYKIKYIISPFNIVSNTSDYFPDPVFRGVHKSYKYWFTGENTQVLHFEQQFNALYKMVMSDSPELAYTKQATNNRDIVRRVYQPFSDQSAQGANLRTNEPGANLADSLYSPYDLNTIKLKIVGDPAFLQQGEVAGTLNERNISFTPFNDDGTINFQAGDVVFDITWSRPQDYDLNTGLMDPLKNSTAGNKNGSQEQENATYYGREIISTFRGGRFEQVLDGVMLVSNPTGIQKLQQGEAREPTTSADIPNVRLGDGVKDAQASSGTVSTGFTNTQQPNLLSSAIADAQSSSTTGTGTDTANGTASLEEPQPQPQPEPATSNADIAPSPTISTAVTDAQLSSGSTVGNNEAELALEAPPKLPSIKEEVVDWNNIPSIEIRGTADSIKNKPTPDDNPQLMNREF